jgi:hypothetical protein
MAEGWHGDDASSPARRPKGGESEKLTLLQRDTARQGLDLGLRHYDRATLEAVCDRGEVVHINVLGLASIADDVSPDLARATIASVNVLGALAASPAVKNALSDRIR